MELEFAALLISLLTFVGFASAHNARKMQQQPSHKVRQLFGFTLKQGQKVAVDKDGDGRRFYIIMRPPWETSDGRLVFGGVHAKQAKHDNPRTQTVVIAEKTDDGWRPVAKLELQSDYR